MSFRRLLRASAILLAAAVLAACSPQPPAPSAPVTPTNSPQDAENLALYDTLVERGQFELAAPIGEGVIRRAPQSPAAIEIGKSIDKVKDKARAIEESARLAGLWLYQSGEQSGGQQNTATISPGRPAWARDRVRLILRRHSDWGQSAYLYDTAGKGFVCKGKCKLALEIDGEPAKPLVGYLPDSKDPAMFIDQDAAFVALLEKASRLAITVQVADREPEIFSFEVSGFAPDKWPKPRAGKR